MMATPDPFLDLPDPFIGAPDPFISSTQDPLSTLPNPFSSFQPDFFTTAKDTWNIPFGNEEGVVCQTHLKPLELYCNTDQEFICVWCRSHPAHKDHHISLAWEILSETNSVISEKLEKVQSNVTDIDEAVKLLETRKEDLIKQGKAITDKVTKKIEAMIASKVQVLDQQKNSAVLARDSLNECKSFLELHRSSFRMVKEREQMIQRVDLVLSETPDPEQFKPLEKANIVLTCEFENENGQNGLKKKNENCILQVNEKASLTSMEMKDGVFTTSLIIPSSYGSLSPALPSQISCEVCTADESPIPCIIKQTHPHTYSISFKPSSRGKHLLKVEVGFVHILGSPFTLSVRKDPIMVIPGLKVPRRLGIRSGGGLVVAEWGVHRVTMITHNGDIARSFGTKGVWDGQFTYPYGVALLQDDHVLVSDEHRLQKLTSNGEPVKSIGGPKPDTSQSGFCYPSAIAVHPIKGEIYVVDSCNSQIKVFDTDLNFLHIFSSNSSDDGQFDNPCDLAFDADGFLFVADGGNHCIKKFTPESEFFSRIPANTRLVFPPSSVAVDSNKLVYITERGCDHVSVFDCDGTLIDRLGGWNDSEHGCLKAPCSVAIDGQDNLYVSDSGNSRIVVY